MSTPLIPPEKARLNQELKLTGEYNLRNKHEVKRKVQLQFWGKLFFNLKHFLAASANSLRVSYGHWHNLLTWSRTLATVLTHFRSYYVQGGFFYCSALKMTK